MLFMTKEISISVVIPTYNVGEYIGECLESVLNQTEAFKEVICVDDLSDDNTCEVIERYVKDNPVVKLVKLPEKGTANIARKVGAAAATGDYIWFIDGDDLVKPESVAELRKLLKDHPVDILQFNVDVQNCANLDADRIKRFEKFVRPFNGELKSKDVFEGCFKKSKYQFNLWNKVFSKELCQKAFTEIETIQLPIAQDKYAFYVLAYFAQSYFGAPDKYFYIYRFGLGVTGQVFIDRKRFKRYCHLGDTAQAIVRFSQSKGIDQDIIESSSRQLLSHNLAEWERLNSRDKAWGYSEIVKHWDAAYVVSMLTKKDYYNRKRIASCLTGFDEELQSERKVQRIGVYYHRLSIGGAQRVVVKLIELWRQMGYECVLLTDEAPTPNDYPLPDGVDRVVIPSVFNDIRFNYPSRASALSKIIEQYRIDTVVYHAWVCPCLFWDMLLFKSYSVRVLVHTHNPFSTLLMNLNPNWVELPYVFSLADGVIALSKTDQEFWKQFVKRTFLVVNPHTFEIEHAPKAALNNKNLIWVGRLDPAQKRPEDALRVMSRIVKSHPDARLFMVGDNEKYPSVLANLKRQAEKLGITQNVEFCGFIKEVQPYYMRSSVYLMTSDFEGFSMSLGEALTVGLPVVMYDLPYLTLVEQNRGVITVPKNDISAMANEVIALLDDPVKLNQLGCESRDFMEVFGRWDFEKEWKKIFDALNQECPSSKPLPVMWQTLLGHVELGISRSRNKNKVIPVPNFRTRELLKMLRHKFKQRIKHFFGRE